MLPQCGRHGRHYSFLKLGALGDRALPTCNPQFACDEELGAPPFDFAQGKLGRALPLAHV
jgi:hypothetical protein